MEVFFASSIFSVYIHVYALFLQDYLVPRRPQPAPPSPCLVLRPKPEMESHEGNLKRDVGIVFGIDILLRKKKITY